MQFNTKEGSVVGVDVGIRYKITDARKLAATYIALRVNIRMIFEGRINTLSE